MSFSETVTLLKNRSSIHGRNTITFSSPQHPQALESTEPSVQREQRGISLGVKRPQSKTDNLLSFRRVRIMVLQFHFSTGHLNNNFTFTLNPQTYYNRNRNCFSFHLRSFLCSGNANHCCNIRILIFFLVTYFER
jgi:hypothetical protein